MVMLTERLEGGGGHRRSATVGFEVPPMDWQAAVGLVRPVKGSFAHVLLAKGARSILRCLFQFPFPTST